MLRNIGQGRGNPFVVRRETFHGHRYSCPVGSGKSDLKAYHAERYRTLHGYASDVLEICECLDVRNGIFVGHSVSSMVGALASIEKPEYFERLIMIGPSPRYLNDEAGYFGGFEKKDLDELLVMLEMNFVGWASSFAPSVIRNEDKRELAEELTETFRSNVPGIARQFAEATLFSDHRADLPKVTVPSLILQCSDDSVAPKEVGLYLHRHLKQSIFRFMQVKGHYPHLSHPEETVRVIKEYLQSHTALYQLWT